MSVAFHEGSVSFKKFTIMQDCFLILSDYVHKATSTFSSNTRIIVVSEYRQINFETVFFFHINLF